MSQIASIKYPAFWLALVLTSLMERARLTVSEFSISFIWTPLKTVSCIISSFFLFFPHTLSVFSLPQCKYLVSLTSSDLPRILCFAAWLTASGDHRWVTGGRNLIVWEQLPGSFKKRCVFPLDIEVAFISNSLSLRDVLHNSFCPLLIPSQPTLYNGLLYISIRRHSLTHSY